MNRRRFLATIATSATGALLLPAVAGAHMSRLFPLPQPGHCDSDIRDYLHKMSNFDERHDGDVFVTKRQKPVLRSTVRRLRRLQRSVGFGNFYLLGFDEGVRYARRSTSVGAFTRAELDFMDQIFNEDAATYGFYGGKPLAGMTDAINTSKAVKIPETGNYLYKGLPMETYNKLRADVGSRAVLTSGIRGVMKQFLLFLSKVEQSRGNLSQASRSLAPPGYSFHGIGDFDVGQVGFGADNFTDRFVSTEVFHRLTDLGYVSLRYPRGNLLGVRFEPWHIQVGDRA